MQNSIIKSTSTLARLCAVIVTSAGAGQFSQLLYSSSDLRVASLAEWAGDDLERQATVKTFNQECLIGPKPVDNSITTPISIMECAESKGFTELATIAKNSDKNLKSYAWPLSLIAPHEL